MFPTRRRLLAAAMVCFVWNAAHAADAFPQHTITMVVSFAPGSDTDAMARLMAEKLSARVKQPVVVVNRPGASGSIGNRYVSHAAPDGYTLLFSPNGLPTAPLVMKLPPASNYDPVKDFTPIIQVGVSPILLVANADTGFKTLADMVAAARRGQPLSYASSGAGSPMNIAGEWLNHAAGIQVQHVAYKGIAPAAADVVAGHVPLAFVTLGPVEQYLKNGRLVALAVSNPERSTFLPDLPTISESGYPDVKVGAWYGIFGPKNVPEPVVAMLNRHFNAILKEDDVAKALAHIAADPVGGPPARLGELNRSDYQRLGPIIAELGIETE